MKRRKQPPTERAIARMTDPPRRDVLTAEERATVENFRADVRCGYEIPMSRRLAIVAIIDRLAPKGE